MTLYKLKLYLRLYWSTFLSYFKKKKKNEDVFVYENDVIEKALQNKTKKWIDED